MLGEGENKGFMQEDLVPGKVFQVTRALIRNTQLIYEPFTHFLPIEDTGYTCFSENEFLTSDSLNKFKPGHRIHNVLLMKIIGKYVAKETTRDVKRRGIIQLADNSKTNADPIKLVTFDSLAKVEKLLETAIVGKWIKLFNFKTNLYRDTLSLVNHQPDLTIIPNIKSFPWLKDEEVSPLGGEGSFTRLMQSTYYKACIICTKSQDTCACPKKHIQPVYEQRCSILLHFRTSDDMSHELTIHFKTLKENNLIPENLPDEKDVFNQLIKRKLLNKTYEILWFIGDKDKHNNKRGRENEEKPKKLKKIVTSIIPII